MPNFIPKDFTPSDQSYNNLAKHGAIKDFVDSQLDTFVTYWTELKDKGSAKGKKESWQATFQTWMRRAWNGKVGREWERTRHYTTRAPSDNPLGDAIETLFGMADESKEPEKPKPPVDYPKRKVAQGGPPMTAEQAFDQLRKDGFL